VAEAVAAGPCATMLGPDLIRLSVANSARRLVSRRMRVIVPNITRCARGFGVIEGVVTHLAHRRRGLGGAVLETGSRQGPT